ncbi:outer membrane beta-barrel protein [Salegentibacter sp. BLCTC]|uniref:TonB-dependent receptor n=1 Tax=Salegentibacter sp. BLCTC TaxID=2697368 RepID=UPI00187B9CFA|nr:TonB-dependent receptor [Salegentibacter sp. BLCTC]MBE7641726.1 outer membrane beta-barrel protein [Salegentibacter sp. BLCTC]
MRFFFSFALLILAGNLTAQNFEINGKVTGPQGEPLESATVYLEKPVDSSLVTYTISDNSGTFQLAGNEKLETAKLLVSYAGFKTYSQTVEIGEKLNLGTIKMQIADNALDEITITSSRAPVTIKKDTLEFNAASFKTRKDANLEELLKELPGVEVATDGSITVNGTPVSQIKVNGKEFFGDDPKIATKNLPKELINKLQVVDSKTKSEEFTGKEGDAENKTINITIDEDKNRGFFSRLTAGGGTNERYELSGIGNYFKDDLRVSLLASSNNINSSGFSFDEIYDSMGRNAYSISRSRGGSFSVNGNSFGSGSGITRSDNAGFNFVNEWPQETELSSNYFYSRADNITESKTQRENILPDRRFFNNSESSGQRLNNNHRFSLGFEIQPDTLTRISVRPNINTNNGRSSNQSFTESIEENGTPINTALTDNYSEVHSVNFSNRLYFTRKFGENGGYYSLGFNNQNNNRSQDNNFFSEREIYNQQGELERTDVQDQLISEENTDNNYGINVNTRIPITEGLKLDVSYNFDKRNGRNERLVYDGDDEGSYTLLDDELSNDFVSESFEHRPSLGLAYNSDKLRAHVSGGFQSIRLKNKDLFTETSIDNTYENLFANAYFRLNLSQGKSIYFNYRNSWETPSLSQLQPVTNTINPLNIITGNPNLRPALRNRLHLNFNNFDFKTRSGFYVYLGANFINNKVVSRSSIDEDLVRTTTYTNVDGAYNYYGGGTLDKTFELQKESSIKVKTGLYGNFDKNIGFTNEQRYSSKSLRFTPSLNLEYNFRDLVTIEPFYSIEFVDAEYSFNNREENYKNQNISLALTSFWPEKFVIGSDISYQTIGNASPGFQNSFYLWNASLGYEIFGEDGVLKVKVFDLLDQNIATRRFTGDDFIQDTQQLVLEQYFMLSFTYKISKFGGKDPNNKRGRR